MSAASRRSGSVKAHRLSLHHGLRRESSWASWPIFVFTRKMVYHSDGSARKDVDYPARGTRRSVGPALGEIRSSHLLGSSGSGTNLSGCSPGFPVPICPPWWPGSWPGTCCAPPAAPGSVRGGPAGHVGRQTFQPTPCQTPSFEAIKAPRSVRVWAVSTMYRIPVAARTSPRWDDSGHCRAEVAVGQNQNPATTPPGFFQGELQGCLERARLGRMKSA